jgi:hypothetical protein
MNRERRMEKRALAPEESYQEKDYYEPRTAY